MQKGYLHSLVKPVTTDDRKTNLPSHSSFSSTLALISWQMGQSSNASDQGKPEESPCLGEEAEKVDHRKWTPSVLPKLLKRMYIIQERGNHL